MKVDFEFVSTHRNRTLWPNPCCFEVGWSSTAPSNAINAYDPVSDQVPLLVWVGSDQKVTGKLIAHVGDWMVVAFPIGAVSPKVNNYRGMQLSMGSVVTRIVANRRVSSDAQWDYFKVQIDPSLEQQVPDSVVSLEPISVPGTWFVPGGSDVVNAYSGMYLYNETLGQWVVIRAYDHTFHLAIPDSIMTGWDVTHQYSIRPQLPSLSNFLLDAGSTTTLIATRLASHARLGDWIRIVTTGECAKVVNVLDGSIGVSPPLSRAFFAGTPVELLGQIYDNYQTLSYPGLVIGNQEQSAYQVTLVSAFIPNVETENGGYPNEYPFLYVEFSDTHYPYQNNLFSNNHSNKSWFKVTTPTGLYQSKERWIKFTGDYSFKTIRFKPTSNFRIVWRTPSGAEVKFTQPDTQSPSSPDPSLQTFIQFNMFKV
ncbi:hypothetical protein MIV069L [Invertebrate iridescent virus 3]|uniref:Uncharacterized protein 069L n=1 Tax=Invertebrate iridescent virus 3 TaxID=345201 RepID=VF198_IIV3|nr:hypothetical protein MIV069L [Invertebrate iridescent virus 3]Q196Z1.1 RecName: Full=Uncharacterized protein 069L [Invertebrate iridescent virus 3]ABF82099.1 hypothetical protein MIV069L [Invertebrate iridescent virus 3]